MATDTTPATGTGRTGITRPVLLAGIVLGTCLTILAMWNGVRLRVPGIPSILGAALGALIVWALFMAAAAVLSELTVRHHRAAIRTAGGTADAAAGPPPAGGPGARPGARPTGRARGARGSSPRCRPGGPHAARLPRRSRKTRPGAMSASALAAAGRSPPAAPARPARPAGKPARRIRAPAPPTRGDPRTARPAGRRMTRRRRTAGRST